MEIQNHVNSLCLIKSGNIIFEMIHTKLSIFSSFFWFQPNVTPEQAERARLECEAYRAINEIAKSCPSCGAKIDRSKGCNHMTCKCGFDFCWLCLVKWTGDCQDKHWFQDCDMSDYVLV